MTEARLDIRARRVWERGQKVLLKLLQQCPRNEQTRKEKSIKRESSANEAWYVYTIVFSIYGSMGREYHTFYPRLSDSLL